MTKVIFGNHSSVIVPRQDRENIRKFYCDVLGGKITKEQDERDFIRLGENFYIVFLYGDVPDESEFVRTARTIWLEIKSDNVEEMRRKILESGLVRKLDIPDPHLYFQAPGGQCWRLVGINEDLSFYEGAGEGPDVKKIKEAVGGMKTKKNFNCTISAKISADEAIKRINYIPGWWGVTFSGSSEKQNDKFIVKMSGDSFFNFTVAELIPGRRVVWLVTDCNMPWYSDKKEWTNTKLIFDLSENNGVTTLNFTHEGLTPDVECYKDCETGWTHWITTSLSSYFTTGKGEMKDQSYTATVEFAKSPGDVFKRINDVSKWWTRVANGEQTEFEGRSTKLNDEFILRHGESHYSKQKLVEVIPGKKVVWFVTDSKLNWLKKNQHEWTGTKMIFELTSKGDKTALNFIHQGLVPEKECYDHSVQFWDMVIKEWLFNFITNNKGI